MNIVVVGAGYVGLVTGACFAEMGNRVFCVDIDQNKIEKLNKGVVSIFEPGLELLVQKNLNNKNLTFFSNIEEVINKAEVIFIAVGTPMGEDGSADLTHVIDVAKTIGKKINKKMIIVDKSTVPVGTADKVRDVVKEELFARQINIDFDVVSNPEFLKEGTAVNDFMKPDRIVIGASSNIVFEKMKQLYSPFFRTHDRFITMDIRSAEMTKYAANAMLATKISFMNEIANICERVGADVNNVRIGIGSDKRIGYSFIYPGVGYGGSCLPKDVRALKKISEENDYEASLITAVEKVNTKQKLIIINKVVKRFGKDLSKLTFGIWGLAFKPGTDDMREAPAVYVVNELIKRGAKVKVYDPKAIKVAKDFYFKGVGNIEYYESKYMVLKEADALILLTEWKEFRSPDFHKIKEELKSPVIFDGRNQYMVYKLNEIGVEYYRIGN